MCWGSYTYGYDAIGNLKTRTGSKALTYTYDTSNRLSTVTGAAARTYGYDARARVTSDGRFTFNWNQADQITGPRGVATYSYDGNGKRAKVDLSASTTEYAFYDLAGKLRATIKGSTIVDYLDLDGKPFVERSSSGAVTYLHPDWLGSPRLATKADGTMLWREHFDPYGKKLNGVVEKRGFTGHAYDTETGMTYMLARYYDPEVGRFLMTDPIGSKDDLNLYAYVHGDPVNGTDPTGTCSPSDGQCDGGSNTFEVGSAGLPGAKDKSDPSKTQSGAGVGSRIPNQEPKSKDPPIVSSASQSASVVIGSTSIAGTADATLAPAISIGVRINPLVALASFMTSLLSGDTPQFDFYIHYGYANDSPKFKNGLNPNSFATKGPIMSSERATQLLSLPVRPMNVDSYYNVRVSRSTPVIAPPSS